MPKLKLPKLDDVVAIDIHTHAEEPCGLHADDGYDDFQQKMAEDFKSPNAHPRLAWGAVTPLPASSSNSSNLPSPRLRNTRRGVRNG